jgi:hypothetical protein
MAPNCKIYALKRIRLQGRDAEAAAGFVDEITILKQLRGRSNIIQLVDSQVGIMPCSCLPAGQLAAMPCGCVACRSHGHTMQHCVAAHVTWPASLLQVHPP